MLNSDHTDGDLAIGDQYIYLAMWGCRAITRLDKKTLQQEVICIGRAPGQ